MAPIVTYLNGELRIDTENSKLGDVLNAIGGAIGALIDKPPAADNERVAAHLSGSPRRVIAALLDDGKYGYAILYPMGDPSGIQKVILRSQVQDDVRPSAAAATQLANRRAPSNSQAVRPASPVAEAGLTPEFAAPAVQDNRNSTDQLSSSASTRVANSSDSGSSSAANVSPDALLQDNLVHATKQLAEVTAQLSTTSASPDSAAQPSPDAQQGNKTPMQVLQDLIEVRRQLQVQQNQAQKTQPAQ